VDKPWHVIPHGVNLRSLSPEKVAEVRRRYRTDGELVMGFHASWLRSRGDRQGDDPFHNVDHLLELWEDLRNRVPGARLWLTGSASKRVRRLCGGRDDIGDRGYAAAHVFDHLRRLERAVVGGARVERDVVVGDVREELVLWDAAEHH
jgi:glycosyltransferase involved in cell wall biosynthesis